MSRIREDIPLEKIVSGGQTGVDQAGLEVAIFFDLPHGGFCPKGRRSENGRIPQRFQLVETDSRDYAVRTEKNLIHSDGTLLIFQSRLTGGSLLTFRLCKKHKKPCHLINTDDYPWLVGTAENENRDLESLRGKLWDDFGIWLRDCQIKTLNVAGPRESTVSGIGQLAEVLLTQLLSPPPSHD